jgi:hypothetical protein
VLLAEGGDAWVVGVRGEVVLELLKDAVGVKLGARAEVHFLCERGKTFVGRRREIGRKGGLKRRSGWKADRSGKTTRERKLSTGTEENRHPMSARASTIAWLCSKITHRVTEQDVRTGAEEEVAADLVVPPIIVLLGYTHGLGAHHLLQNQRWLGTGKDVVPYGD